MLALITEQDLKEAIAECQGQRNPNASTCIKLAAFLTIQKELFGNSEQPEAVQPFNSYSYSADNKEKIVDYSIETEFGKLIDGKIAADAWDVMQELMDALKITNPKLYNFVLRKLEQI